MRHVSEPDNGIYDAMNKGIGMAQGELLWMLNSDAAAEPGALTATPRPVIVDAWGLYHFGPAVKYVQIGVNEQC